MSPATDDDDQGIHLGAAETDTDQGESKAGDDSSEEESDSDVEYHERKIPVKDLLDNVLAKIRSGELDLTNKGQYDSFIALNGEHLASNTGDARFPTALHHMTDMEKDELPKLDAKVQPLVTFLAKRRDCLMTQDRFGLTPLFHAIETKKKEMVQWMCDAHPDISSVLAIPSKDDKKNCLHIGVDKRVRFLDLLVDRADPRTLVAKDANGNTPLHLAVEYKKCKKEQLSIIERIVNKSDQAILDGDPGGDFNNDGLSPYLHHKETVKRARDKERKKAKEESEKSNSRRLNPGTADEPGRELQKGIPASTGPPSIHGGDPRGRPDIRLNTQLNSHTKYGGRAAPAPPVANSPVVTAAPSVHKSDDKKKSSRVDETTVKNVERFLKLHYLRTRSYPVAMEVLYGRNTTSDQELNFDLSGDVHGNGVINLAGLDNLLSKLVFEDVLQYVAIPRISIQANRPSERSGTSRRAPKQDGTGRRDLCYIFDRLRKKGVKTIIKVLIDDLDAPAHSDEAIEDCLKSMDVEVWDWKKIDLCTEVIYKIAPRAREVNLYWSGNNAVLRGWSEEGGLKKLRELRTVNLYIQQGLETNFRTKQNVKEFIERMKRLYPEVTVNKEKPRGVSDANAARAEDQPEHLTKHEWIQCMKDFRKLLIDAERCHDAQMIEEGIEESIKVALIDDGVDIKDLKFNFIGGRTFCTRDQDQNLNSPYYVSGAGHGTIMARQIYQVCPRAQFYVLRLEDHRDEGLGLITAKSAAQAIHAAVRKRVHIISMSWTIDPPENEADRRALDNAIAEAASADILMFCSASDKGAKQNATYPAKATPKIFTIGAAMASGAADPWVGSLTNISFTFPGNEVELDEGPTETSVKEVTGSSVATALAAGLAALILYCVQIRVLFASDQEKHKARAKFKEIKKHDGMMTALKDIGTTEESNHKFIQVWDVFGPKVLEKEGVDPEEWIHLISEVGELLCRKIR